MMNVEIHHALGESPDHGLGFWLKTTDGFRIRLGVWRSAEKEKGTVLIFPGRCEYVEKYGKTISDLLSKNYSVAVIDWRGQGLSDRHSSDRKLGHVNNFSDYQADVEAFVKKVKDLDFTGPFFLLGHSMGACIGFRSLLRGLDVKACAFTSPLWGIRLPRPKLLAAKYISNIALFFGQPHMYAPGTGPESYVLANEFSGNRLTNDSDMYEYYIRQATHLTEHQIGGPSMGWLSQAIKETSALKHLPSPSVPCQVFCGMNDEVIDVEVAQARMKIWPMGKFTMIENAKHDLLSEVPSIRHSIVDQIDVFFSKSGHIEM
jgi:lysophospholipase